MEIEKNLKCLEYANTKNKNTILKKNIDCFINVIKRMLKENNPDLLDQEGRNLPELNYDIAMELGDNVDIETYSSRIYHYWMYDWKKINYNIVKEQYGI